MMPTKTLSEVLAAAQTATSLSGLSMLLRNSAGGLAAAGLTNAVLKSILTDAMVIRGEFSNIDECKTPGIWVGGGALSTGTFPPGAGWSYGSLEVFPARPSRIVQRLTSEDGYVATRIRLSGTDSSWTGWKILT